MATHTRTAAAKLIEKAKPDNSKFINWIASYPRSGNTWVRALLLAYQQGEAFDVNRMEAIPGEPPKGYYDILSVGAYSQLDWVYMRPQVFKYAYSTRRYKDFTLKTHTANIQVCGSSLIPSGYTNKAVYIMRDPRDVLCSCSRYFKKSHEGMLALMENPEHVLTDEDTGTFQFLSSYMNHINSWTKEKSFPVHTVTYSNLLNDPGAELIGILRFFDPDALIDKERVKFAIDVTNIGKLRKLESGDGFRERPPGVDQFFGQGESGGWRTELSPEIVERIKAWR